ncbi:MAG: hypothetical protein OSJ28_09485, partial [Desulfovibrio sp.]|nr:hypothetical protein [Desulfovibrio sp.]
MGMSNTITGIPFFELQASNLQILVKNGACGQKNRHFPLAELRFLLLLIFQIFTKQYLAKLLH